MPELLIIADDLTGAIEAGVQLSKQGIPAEIVVDSNTGLKKIIEDKKTPAVVVNTESRHIPPAEAAGRVLNVLNSVEGYGFKWFYKKTDSTMRGNIGAELEAFMHGTNQTLIPYIPAHPKVKRFTRKGYQFIDDILLHQTSFANDPLEPVKFSFVPGILKQQTKMEICLAAPDGIFRDNHFPGNDSVVVFDCGSESDLHLIGKTILKNGWQNATAGTAGFVEILLNILPLNFSEVRKELIKGPLLIVNGSLNPVSLEQVDHAKNSDILTQFLSRDLILRPDYTSCSAYKQIIETVNTAYSNGRDLIISTFNPSLPQSLYDMGNVNRGSFPGKVGRVIASILREVPFKSLCVFGGDTLMGIIKETGCESIEAVSEILPGVAFTKVSTRTGMIQLLSKPGGYGGKDVILRIIQHIKGKC